MSIKNWFRFLLLGLLWGTTYTWVKIGVQEMGPFTLVALRIAFATLAYTIYFLIKRPKLPGKNFWGAFFMIGMLNIVIPFVLISWSEKHISSGLASILNSTQPLFAILIAPLFLPEEKLSGPKVVGLVLGFIGVVVLMADQLNGEFLGQHQVANITMILAALSYASGAVFAKQKTKGLQPDVQAIGQNLMAALVIIPVAAIVEAPFTLPRLPLSWAAVIWMGLLSSCVASLLYFSLINAVGPTRTVLVTYLIALVGVLSGIVFLNEQLNWQLFLGGALVISGIIIVNLKRNQPLTKNKNFRKTS